MRKAMTYAFHGALQVTCTRHLQSNSDKKLDSVVGRQSDERRAINSAIFGSDGLTSCDDVIFFDDKVKHICTDILSNCPTAMLQYFGSCVHSLLRDNVVTRRWTNNNCKSINHVIKQYTQWRPQQLPDLINKLRDLVHGQYTEADRALCGRRDLQLLPACTRETSRHYRYVEVYVTSSLSSDHMSLGQF